MSSSEAWGKLFPGECALRLAARTFLASIQAHALFELGFEEHVNDLSPQERALVATQVCGPMQAIIYDDAVEEAQGETRELLMEARQ
jgi:hypothetical protein